MAVTMARTVTTTELPSRIDWRGSARTSCRSRLGRAASAARRAGPRLAVAAPAPPAARRLRSAASCSDAIGRCSPAGLARPGRRFLRRAAPALGRRRAVCAPAPAISMPSSSTGTVGGAEAGDPALVHHRDPVGQRVDLVQLGGDDDARRRPWSRCSTIRLCTNSIEPDVQAAGRLAGHQHLAVPAELPGQDHLLLVAAGQRARPGSATEVVRTSNSVHPARWRVLRDRGQVERDAAGVRRAVVDVQDQVLGHREEPTRPSSCRSSGT